MAGNQHSFLVEWWDGGVSAQADLDMHANSEDLFGGSASGHSAGSTSSALLYSIRGTATCISGASSSQFCFDDSSLLTGADAQGQGAAAEEHREDENRGVNRVQRVVPAAMGGQAQRLASASSALLATGVWSSTTYFIGICSGCNGIWSMSCQRG